MQATIMFTNGLSQEELLEATNEAKKAVERHLPNWPLGDVDISLRQLNGRVLGVLFIRGV